MNFYAFGRLWSIARLCDGQVITIATLLLLALGQTEKNAESFFEQDFFSTF
jgi:hypothetical protein